MQQTTSAYDISREFFFIAGEGLAVKLSLKKMTVKTKSLQPLIAAIIYIFPQTWFLLLCGLRELYFVHVFFQ